MVDPGAKAALALLAERLAAVAVVFGRAPQDGAAMVGLPELIYVGNHGLERIARGTPWTHPVAAAASRPSPPRWRRSRARRGRWPTPWP